MVDSIGMMETNT